MIVYLFIYLFIDLFILFGFRSAKASRNLQLEYRQKLENYKQIAEKLDEAQEELDALGDLIKSSDHVTYDKGFGDEQLIPADGNDREEDYLEPDVDQLRQSPYRGGNQLVRGPIPRIELQRIDEESNAGMDFTSNADLRPATNTASRAQKSLSMQQTMSGENTRQPAAAEVREDSEDSDSDAVGVEEGLPAGVKPLSVDDWLHRHTRTPSHTSHEDRMPQPSSHAKNR